ncbi:MAG: flagellar biosynthetic protein FliR [Acidimicrobiales bacterium]
MALPSAELIAFFLALVRAAAWILMVPPFNNQSIPMITKVGLAGGLALVVSKSLAAGPLPSSTGSFIGSIVMQVVIGAALGFMVQILFSAISAAGSLTDMLGGIVLPPSLDPLSQNQTPLIGQLYNLVAMILLFVSGADLILVDGFLRSFSVLGTSIASLANIAHLLTSGVATLFLAALEIAAPVLICLFATQVVLGLAAKAAPQLNVFMFGFPLQILIALVLVAISIATIPAFFTHIIEDALRQTSRMLGG